MGVPGALAGCLYRSKRRLNVFNWDNYVATATVSEFERRYQCQVRYSVYASAEEMLAKVLSGNSGWDVVFPSNSFIQPMRELRLLAELDHSRLPGLAHLEPAFQSPEWDPALQWCVPYMSSATGILYSKRARVVPKRWADLWLDAYGRRITMLDDPAEVFAACLKRLGHSVNSTLDSELRAARDLAIQQKPRLRAYLSEQVRDQVAAGDVLVAQMWAQVAQAAMDEAPQLAFCYPEEGFPRYADNLCVLRESRHQELAHAFADYLLEPAVASAIASEIHGATPNAQARALLPPQQRHNRILYPPPDVLSQGEWFRALPPAAQTLRDRFWTEIKSA